MNYLVAVFVLFALLAVALAGSNTPTQVRLQYAGASGSYVITYTTGSSASSTTISSKLSKKILKDTVTPYAFYGTSSSLDQSVAGTSTFYQDTDYSYSANINNVVLSGLEADTTYYYKVGNSNYEVSSVFSFSTAAPTTWAVYGDFGYKNDQSLDSLLASAADRTYQGVLHVGDFAYNLQNEHGKRGDLFLEAIAPISSTMVYMGIPGNHEHYSNFSEYIGRFSGQQVVGANSGSNTNLWYSFESGIAHFTAIDTELYYYSPSPAQQARQIAWLEADLIYANQNREKYPWLIMYGHKCDWQDKVNFTMFRELANGYGVDLYICGHQHNYQRMFPGLQYDVQTFEDKFTYTNPKYWTQVVVGSPGCQEKISSGKGPYTNGTAAFFLSYGYALLTIESPTKLTWKYIQTNAGKTENAADLEAVEIIQEQNKNIPAELRDTPVEMDHMTMIQTSHGPRSQTYIDKVKNSPKLSRPTPVTTFKF